MEISFGEFRYSPEQGCLFKGEQVIVLKRNQAALMALLLSDRSRVFSKDEILQQVWTNQVVSEQVVFQTISQLRAILGEDAIATYSKKGYRWQLPETTRTKPPVEQQQSLALHSRYFVPLKHILALALIGISIIAFYLYAQSKIPPDEIPKAKLHILLAKEANADTLQLFADVRFSASQSSPLRIEAEPIKSTELGHQLAATPSANYVNNTLPESDWLVFGNLYQNHQGMYLHYFFNSHNITWQGYVFGEDLNRLQLAFEQKYARLAQIGLFNTGFDKLELTELLQLHQTTSDMPELQLLLAKEYIYMGQFDTALAHLKPLLTDNQTLIPYQAQAHWLTGKIYKIREQHQMASQALDLMADTLQGSPLWNLSYQNLKTSALLAFEEMDYPRMFEILNKGTKLAATQADPYTKFDMHIMFVMLAEKAQKPWLKQLHLDLAQTILIEGKLNDSNLVSYYYHLAQMASNDIEALPDLEKLLALPNTADNYWLHEAALTKTVAFYLDKKDFNAAHQIIKAPLNSAHKLKLKADVWLAQGQVDLAVPLLISSFDQARLEYNKAAGLEAAIEIMQLDSTLVNNKLEYAAFIDHYGGKKALQ